MVLETGRVRPCEGSERRGVSGWGSGGRENGVNGAGSPAKFLSCLGFFFVLFNVYFYYNYYI